MVDINALLANSIFKVILSLFYYVSNKVEVVCNNSAGDIRRMQEHPTDENANAEGKSIHHHYIITILV